MTTLTAAPPAYADLEIGRYPLPPGTEVTDEFMRELQELNPDKIVECWKNRELVITVGAGGGTSGNAVRIIVPTTHWTDTGGGGEPEEAEQGFLLPDGTRYKPDFSWIDPPTLAQIRQAFGHRTNWPEYLPFTPAFVVEIASPSDKSRDNLAQQHAKTAHWVEQGVQVAWLIDPFDQAVHVYRQGREPETHQHPEHLEVGPEMPGLTIDFIPIWE